jgi:hypothetical protein
MKRWIGIAAALLFACAVPATSRAAEIGHYVPGLVNIRDLYVPDPGFYGVVYNYIYTTDRLNDAHGDKINSVTIAPRGGPGATLNVGVDIDMYALVPLVMWVSNWKLFGAKYAAYIAPTFADASIHAKLSTATGRGGKAEAESFDVGDLFVQPVWLGWTGSHYDFSLGYGFYAPTGKYDTETRTLRSGGTVKVEKADNIGFGFWTQQFQGAAAWYPWKNKATAVSAGLTYENHQDKEDFRLEPGDDLSLNWGISQYLPLTKSQHLLLEIGPMGYDSWQITDDAGRDASNNVHDQVHAVGGQIGLTYVPWTLVFNFHGLHEFSSDDRFQGETFVVSAAKKF